MNWLSLGKFALANWSYFALAAVLGWAWIQGQRIDAYQQQAAGYERSIQAHEDAARINAGQLERCEQINLANAQEIDRQMKAAREAAQRVELLTAELESRVAAIPVEVENFNDEECRMLDEPLPADFVDWLRNDA